MFDQFITSPFSVMRELERTMDEFGKKAKRVVYPYSSIENKTKGELTIELAVTGLSTEDISITRKQNTIIVRTKNDEEPAEETDDKKDEVKDEIIVHFNYIKKPRFDIPFKIPEEYDVNTAKATVKNGLCTIKIFKSKTPIEEAIEITAE